MNTYTFYNASGELLFTYSGFSLDTMIELHSELDYISGSYDSNIYYVLDGNIEERPNQNTKVDRAQIKADGIDILTIFDAPVGNITIYGNENKKLLQGTINHIETFITTIPDTYQISIIAFPYLPFHTTFEAI